MALVADRENSEGRISLPAGFDGWWNLLLPFVCVCVCVLEMCSDVKLVSRSQREIKMRKICLGNYFKILWKLW